MEQLQPPTARLTEGFRRLSLATGIVASVTVIVWLFYDIDPLNKVDSSKLLLVALFILGFAALAFCLAWAFVRLVGWVWVGFK